MQISPVTTEVNMEVPQETKVDMTQLQPSWHITEISACNIYSSTIIHSIYYGIKEGIQQQKCIQKMDFVVLAVIRSC